MIRICAAGPRIFLTCDALPRDEFVLWQELGQILVESADDAAPFRAIRHEIAWTSSHPDELEGALSAGGEPIGMWRARAREDGLAMAFSVRNATPEAWPVAEAFMCYKHRGAPDFWDPELERTYMECAGQPAVLRDWLIQQRGADAFRRKNHLHRLGCGETFDRYGRVGLRIAPQHGWDSHRDATSGGWMAIVSRDGRWVSGIAWEGTQMLAQNAPDYGCIHAGIALGTGIQPGQTVERKGILFLSQAGLPAFLSAVAELNDPALRHREE